MTYTAAELNRFEAVLKTHGFNLKTKALKSYILNPNEPKKGASKYINQIKEFGYTDEQSLVYGVMLLNYALNGSRPNFGNYLMAKAYYINNSFYMYDRRKNGFNTFVDSVQNKTYRRWLNVINGINILREIIDEENIIKIKSVKVETKPKSPETKELSLKQIETLLGFKIKLVA